MKLTIGNLWIYEKYDCFDFILGFRSRMPGSEPQEKTGPESLTLHP